MSDPQAPTDPAEPDWLDEVIDTIAFSHVSAVRAVRAEHPDMGNQEQVATINTLVDEVKREAKAAITAHLQAAEKKGWSDGYHAGWNAYNESPYNPHEAKLTRLGKDSV